MYTLSSSIEQILHCTDKNSGKNLLHVAIEVESYEVFNSLINIYELCRLKDLAGQNALDYAINHQKLFFIQKLVQCYPELIESRSCGWKVADLQRAVENNNISRVQAMLHQNPVAVWSFSFCGESLIHFAAKRKTNVAMICYLLTILPKSIVTLGSETGDTVMHYAVQAKAFQIVDILHKADARLILIKDGEYGLTPFLLAVKLGLNRFVAFFLNLCPDVIHHSQCDIWNALFVANHPAMMRKLLQIKPDLIHGRDNRQETVLHHAVRFGKTSCILLLLEANPNLVSCKNNHGDSPLRVAFDKRKYGLVCMLLKRMPDIQDVDKDGITTLHMAVRCCAKDVLAQVLQHNEHLLNSANYPKETPLQLAMPLNKFDAAKLLLPHATVDVALMNAKTYNLLSLQPVIRAYFLPLDNMLLRDLTNIVLEYLDCKFSF